jgi:hypothetical protein
MPETTTETPPEKTMRRWYEAKLAERLLQAGQMAKDRALLRRGARKMQDGVLGAPEGPEEEDMQIRVGDEVHYHQGQQKAAPSSVRAKMGTLAKLGIAAALFASGAGIGAAVPLVLDALTQAPAATATDHDTQYEARFEIE